MNTNPTPTQPPQRVMAPAEALAVLVDCADVLDDHGKANRARLLTGARATFVALLDEVEALRADLKDTREECDATTEQRDALSAELLAANDRASALLARCEGLEAALREIVAIDPRSDAARLVAIGQARKFAIAALAATRTTGGDAGIASRAADDAVRPHTTPED